MAEYLKRDDVLSNADIITVQTREYGNIDVIPVEYLADLPTADVVEVVRCEKCEYSKLLIDNENRNHIFRHCRMINAFVKDNSFCSYGVRSEGKEVKLNGIQIRKKLL